jgi:GTPase
MNEIIEVGLQRGDRLTAERAILVGIRKLRGEGLRSMRELAQLATSAGAVPVDVLIQQRDTPHQATYLGKGKVAELKALQLSADAQIVLFDDELTPVQVSNLIDQLDCKVLDRTELILDIFAQHATSREGQLQVELAQLSYMAPRLVGKGRMMDRIAGADGGGLGGVGVRGPGETKLETDRRTLRRKMSHLKEKLEEVRGHREIEKRARARSGLPLAALVGYTNAGKSTLLNALVGSDEVNAHDRLFETLDTTIRKAEIEGAELLISDTVGFIHDLPEDLFAAFMATFEQVQEADVIVHVLDASTPWAATERAASEETLDRLGVADRPTVVALNKWDKIAGTVDEKRILAQMPDGLPVAAEKRVGLEKLGAEIARAAYAHFVPLTLHIPYDQMAALHLCRERGRVIQIAYEPDYVAADVEVETELLNTLKPFVVAPA